MVEIYADAIAKKNALDDDAAQKRIKSQFDQIDQATKAANIPFESVLNSPNSSTPLRDQAQLNIDLNNRAGLLQKVQKALGEYNNAAIRGSNNVKEFKENLDGLNASLDENKKKISDDENKIFFDQLGDIASGIKSISSSLGQLGQSLQTLNPQLGDTLQQFAKLGSIAGSLAAGIASGNVVEIISGSLDAVTEFTNLITSLKTSAAQANAQILAYQNGLITGAVQYNELLRDRARSQEDISKLTIQELEARQKMLDIQKQQSQLDYNKLLAQIQ